MANEEHLRILRQGVEVWNQWRESHPEIEIDLSEVDFTRETFTYVNFSKVNFNGASFNEASLYSVNFSEASLYRAYFIKALPNGANFFRANLTEANLSGAYLPDAILREADLSRAIFNGAYLNGANFRAAHLSQVNFSEADLSRANLTEVDLSSVNLHRANLSGANLSGAGLSDRDFGEKNLTTTKLSGADLLNANLRAARLIEANLDRANLTGVRLWETQRSGWSIKDVACEYVYWDKGAKEKTFYQPGDFERLFSEQPKIKLFYKDGANLLEIATLPSIIKNLEEKHPGCKLSFQSIEETSGGAIATLVLEESKDIAVEEVEAVRALIQAEAERNIEAFRQALASKDTDIAQLQGEVRALDRTINTMMGKLRPVNYINQGQVLAMGDGAQAHDSTLNQIVNAESSSVDTQIPGERNIAVADASDSNVSAGDKPNIE